MTRSGATTGAVMVWRGGCSTGANSGLAAVDCLIAGAGATGVTVERTLGAAEIIGADVVMGRDVVIGAGVVIGRDAVIGADVVIGRDEVIGAAGLLGAAGRLNKPPDDDGLTGTDFQLAAGGGRFGCDLSTATGALECAWPNGVPATGAGRATGATEGRGATGLTAELGCDRLTNISSSSSSLAELTAKLVIPLSAATTASDNNLMLYGLL